MSIAFTSDVVFRFIDTLVHSGFEAVGGSNILSAPVVFVEKEGVASTGLVLMDDAGDVNVRFMYSGRVEIAGAVILHPTENPIDETLDGLYFLNYAGDCVASIDTSGNLHVIKPIVQKASLTLSVPSTPVFLSETLVQYDQADKYYIQGDASAYPLLQIVNASSVCTLKIYATGQIETIGIVVNTGIGGVPQDVIFGSYKF